MRRILSLIPIVFALIIVSAATAPAQEAVTQLLSPEQEHALKPKDSFKECESCPQMVVVPAGLFTMGSPEDEKGRLKDEGPQHRVTIAKPFAVGKFEVTVDQFAAFVAETRYNAIARCLTSEDGKLEERSDRSWRNPGFTQGGSHPVSCINWDDAKAYVAWLSRKTGKPYRLLSEAEWEYAARAGTMTRYHFGDEEKDLCGYSNGADWHQPTCKDGYAQTSPVGSFSPNAFGLHDMHGNVWEWVEDCSNQSYEGAPLDGSARVSGNCNHRLFRGGSWLSRPEHLRSAVRSGYVDEPYIVERITPVFRSLGAWADIRASDLGMRVARTLAP